MGAACCKPSNETTPLAIPPPTTGAARTKPTPPKPEESPNAKNTDAEYQSELQALGHAFARVSTSKKTFFLAAGADKSTFEICAVVGTTAETFHATLNREALASQKEATKLTWQVFFRTLRAMLRKASIKEGASAADPLTIAVPVEKGPALTFSLKPGGSPTAIQHRMILTPMLELYAKHKSGDDSSHTKIEVELTKKKVSVADSTSKLTTLQAEIEPLSTVSKQKQDQARSAREKVGELRRNIRRLKLAATGKNGTLYPDAPMIFLLHSPHSEEHYPAPHPANPELLSLVRERFGGEIATRSAGSEGMSLDRVMKILTKLDDWDFDVLGLHRELGGSTLCVTTYALLHKHGLVKQFNIDEKILVNFLTALESGYHPNPYHNAVHAADVLQIMHYIIGPGGLKQAINMTPQDCLACLLSAAIHDYDHPGLNNHFHIRTNAYLSFLYNERSILENHHLTQVFELFKNPKYNIFATLTFEQYKDVRDTMLEIVLNTDMGLHWRVYQAFRRRVGTDAPWTSKEDQRMAMSVALKMADINNSCRSAPIYAEWSRNVAAEFYNQGDLEARLGLVVSPFMDRHKDATDFPKGQLYFINNIVVPLFEAASTLLPRMQFALDEAKRNKTDLELAVGPSTAASDDSASLVSKPAAKVLSDCLVETVTTV